MLSSHHLNSIVKLNNIFKESILKWKTLKVKINKKYTKYSLKPYNPTRPKSSRAYLFTLKKKTTFSLTQPDCYFLKKEKLYTKLKYSRSPQYDIVSGGVAAIFSAFIGFLISEKFGIELVDSGDFYILFMYTVFGVFSIRPLIRIVNRFDKLTSTISLLPFMDLTSQCFVFTFTKIGHVLRYGRNYWYRIS
jgi:hypothetical protein